MRKTCLDCVHELARQDPRVVFIGSDLGYKTLEPMKEEFPERFFMEGVAEANLMGMAAGLAMNGHLPYVNTIATFLSRRCLEQLILDVCHARLPVCVIANGGGLVYAPLGPTHLATDDLALLRPVPHLHIVAPADADEMRRLMPLTLDLDAPLYIRLARGYDPIVTPNDQPFEVGRGVPVQEGDEVLLLTTGIGLRVAREAAALLPGDMEVGILHLPWVKPLDEEAILERASRAKAVVTIEEHTVIGGLGSAVAELLAEHGEVGRTAFRRVGLPDRFPDDYGNQAHLMDHLGLRADVVRDVVLELTGRS